MSLHEYNGITPKLGARVFIAEGAHVIGDVEIGDDSSIWFNTIVRGDVNHIRIGHHTNIQDASICHVQRNLYPCIVGDHVTVGHGVILHGCQVESHCLIGMRSTLLNNVHVGSESIIAAGALITEGTVIPPRSMVMGMPGKVRREVTEEEIARIHGSAKHYSNFKDTYLVASDEQELHLHAGHYSTDMIRAARGTYDILPADSGLWHAIESQMREILEAYAFHEIRTPIFEATELFVRSVGADTDIVSKEMYTFTDRDETTSLTLRPEGTAPVVRSFIENHLSDESRMAKLFYMGPMFRRERPQKGRFRQFYQAGAEVFSLTDNPAIEAEVVEMLMLLFEKLGVGNLELLVNSIGCRECRPPFVERLKGEIQERSSRLCGDCRRRAETNPLRVFDCKVPSCQEPIAELPTITDNLCETCRDHFEKFRGYLDDRKIEYRVEKGLVRGLDYYMRTTLEIVSSELGAQDTLVGGGRYDGLFEDLDGPPMKGFGFAMGLERLILSIPEPEKLFAGTGPDFFLATMGDEAFKYATLLAKKLRAGKRVVYLDFDPRSLKSQMRLAGKLAARNVVILGEDEVRSGKLTVRDMDNREQKEMSEEEFLRAARADEGDPDQMP